MNEKNGRWVTINGTHVFIKDGQSPIDAFVRQKGKSKKEDEEKIIVYHGSPYDFDKFDMKKSKENNQWSNNLEGHYFTENKEFAADYGQYLYEVELTKSKTQRTGSFWEPETKEFYVSNDDNDIKIVHKYKVDNSIKTKDISENINDYEKKLNSLNKISEEWKKQKANVDWEHIEKDKKFYKEEIEKSKKQLEELNKKKYKMIF